MQIAPTNQQLLAGQQRLPDAHRQSSVLCEFRDLTPEYRIGEFARINLTPKMLAGGEDDYYDANWSESLVDPRWLDMTCATCRRPGMATSKDSFVCTTRGCPSYQRSAQIAKRGVVKCWTFPDWIKQATETISYDDGTSETRQIDVTSHVLLSLDRRYSDNVLAQVKRTAFALGEMLHMPLRD